MRLSKTKILLVISLLVLDAFAVSCALGSSLYIRFYLFAEYFSKESPYDPFFSVRYIQIINLLIPVWLMVANYFKLYKAAFVGPWEEFIRAVTTSLVFVFICMILSFSFKLDYSRSIFLIIPAFSSLFLFIFRQIYKFVCLKIAIIFKVRVNNILIGSNVKKYKDVFKTNPVNKMYFYPRQLDSSMLDNIKQMILKKNIKQIILVDYNLSDIELMLFYDWAEYNNIVFKVVPSEIFMCRGELNVDTSLGLPVFRFISDSMSGFDYFLKRCFDVLISFMSLLFLSPFLILIAILIKTGSKGPVIYSQIRQGYRGKTFKFYKFRSMVQDADTKIKEIKNQNLNKDGAFFKIKDDPRITKIGKFIRKYSIDELPQLFNVIKGDMSLVGPRPLVLWEAEQVEKRYFSSSKKRLRVLPGITGLWQILGRSLLSDEKRIELDRFYVEHWTFALDIKILIKTFFVVVFHKGAF